MKICMFTTHLANQYINIFFSHTVCVILTEVLYFCPFPVYFEAYEIYLSGVWACIGLWLCSDLHWDTWF